MSPSRLAILLLFAACTKTADTKDLSKNHLLLRWSAIDEQGMLGIDVSLLEGGARRCRALPPEMKIEANGLPLSLDFSGGGDIGYARGDLYFYCKTPSAFGRIPAPADNIVEIKLRDKGGEITARYELRAPAAPQLLAPANAAALRAGDEVKLRWPAASKSIEQMRISISDPEEKCQDDVTFKPAHDGALLTFTLPTLSDECRAAGATVTVSSFYDEETFEQRSFVDALRCEGLARCIVFEQVTDLFEVGTYAK